MMVRPFYIIKSINFRSYSYKQTQYYPNEMSKRAAIIIIGQLAIVCVLLTNDVVHNPATSHHSARCANLPALLLFYSYLNVILLP